MGLSSKQVSGDQGLDWGQQTFRQSGAPEISKPLSVRRQQPLQQSEAVKCPRCSSTNTKFCYYNNYNKSQPRHFCKSCKRHWTKGGTLRNVPVGGGRKNKRPRISKPAAKVPATSSTATTLRQQEIFSINGEEKNILYQTLIGGGRSSPPLLHETTSKGIDNMSSISTGVNATAADDQVIIPNTEFQFSSLMSSFDMPLNAFGNLESVEEESTITTVNIPAWGGSTSVDLPNYWNWSEIDVLTSGDLSLSWDDQDNAVIKP